MPAHRHAFMCTMCAVFVHILVMLFEILKEAFLNKTKQTATTKCLVTPFISQKRRPFVSSTLAMHKHAQLVLNKYKQTVKTPVLRTSDANRIQVFMYPS